ncbi:hypothetical protein [Pelobium manganitolerans]|uniref:hypothetical protein n=1 Tax=Pelobium manganitolerans TaxID=1842495 RepID=UPI003FA37258
MAYAIIPQLKFKNLNEAYRVINQIFTGIEEDLSDRVKLPYVLLEDSFSEAQILEITTLGGTVFESSQDYLNWLNTYQM